MAQQPVGSDSPFLASSPSQTGAVFFDQAPDLVTVHLKNLEGIDNAIATQKAERAAANKVLGSLLNYKNPDMNGIFPKDREELMQMGKGLVEAQTKLASMGAPNASNPEWISAYNELQNQKQALSNFVAASKSFNKDVTAIGERVAAGDLKGVADSGYYAKKFTENIEKPMAERYGEGYESPATWVRDLPPKLDDMLSAHIQKNFKDMQEPVASTIEIDKGVYGQKISKMNITPANAEAMAKAYWGGGYKNAKDAAQEAWDEVTVANPDVAKNYIDANIAAGMNPILAESKAKEDWLKDHILLNFQKQQNSYKFDGITPQERAKWQISTAQSKQMAKDGWLWTVVKGAIDPNSDVSTPQLYTTSNGVTISLKGNPALSAVAPQTVTVPVYKTDVLTGKYVKDANGKLIQAVDANGAPIVKTIQNHILANGYDANGRLVLVTTESRYLGETTGKTENELMVMKPDQFYDYVKTKVGGGKYAQGSDLVADKEGYRNPTTGQINFKANPNLSKEVNVQFERKTTPPAKVGEGNKTNQLTKKLSSGRTVYSDDGGKTWHP